MVSRSFCVTVTKTVKMGVPWGTPMPGGRLADVVGSALRVGVPPAIVSREAEGPKTTVTRATAAGSLGSSVGIGLTINVSVSVPVAVVEVLAGVVEGVGVEREVCCVVSTVVSSDVVDSALVDFEVDVSSSVVEVSVRRRDVDVAVGSSSSSAVVDEGVGAGSTVLVTTTVVVNPGTGVAKLASGTAGGPTETV